ncbi:unnamed protein product [Cylindrotheca closterium]|uniref:VDE lipocalin domain-containing protein n=1 Tax=Cylindrotheca closterium TaxID=2856 RepID=A0AAD2PX10_9STRA|nr:unnamed protein product [Cylindrotheca closterium]
MSSTSVMKGLLLILATAHAFVGHNHARRSLNPEKVLTRNKEVKGGTTTVTIKETTEFYSGPMISRHTKLMATVSEDSITEKDNQAKDEAIVEPVTGNVVFLLPSNADQIQSKFGSRSPYGNPTVLEAAQHLQRKIGWFSDQLVNGQIVVLSSSSEPTQDEQKLLQDANAVIALHLSSSAETEYAESLFKKRRQRQQDEPDGLNFCQFALECGELSSNELSSICGPFDTATASPSSLLPWTDVASGKRLDERMKGLFKRWTSDDFTYALTLFFNRFSGTPIDWCKHSIDATWEKGPVQNAQELYSMVNKCGDCVVKCVQDEQCKECLDALTALDTTDQVASYRTIVSYESELLENFSYCILQKNNIFNCDAKIPQYPKVKPMTQFRGTPLTRKVARQILIGHLDDEDSLFDDSNCERMPTSWKVAAGANVAYDQFPSQNQIFYEAASNQPKNEETGKQFLWYDPVFRVETIDGRNVWCKRHYRVREGPTIGTFYFSVLDNGVVSNEYWTLVDAADDLSYIIFHYAGAAGAVGQRYLGGLLCTADGSLDPILDESQKGSTSAILPKGPMVDHVYSKLRSVGIEPWELFCVDNRVDSPAALDAGEAPLDHFRKDVLAEKEKRKSQQ